MHCVEYPDPAEDFSIYLTKFSWINTKQFLVIISAKHMHVKNQGIQVMVTAREPAIIPFWSIQLLQGVTAQVLNWGTCGFEYNYG